jgi:hypothetical protein
VVREGGEKMWTFPVGWGLWIGRFNNLRDGGNLDLEFDAADKAIVGYWEIGQLSEHPSRWEKKGE